MTMMTLSHTLMIGLGGLLGEAGRGAAPPDESLYVVWAVTCLVIAVVLFFLELFVPSGGLIGLGAGTSLVAGIVLLFRFNTKVGLVSAIVALGSLPFVFMLALKVWPHTPIARMLLLKNRPGGGPETTEGSGGAEPALCVGLRGKALTDLRPVGTCLIEGRRLECLAESGMIRAGSPVCVVSVDGMHTKVRREEEA